MNIRHTLYAPWSTMSTFSRRTFATLIFILMALAVVFMILTSAFGDLRQRQGAAIIFAIAVAILWAGVIPQVLRLSRLAHQRQIPRLLREVRSSIYLYVVISVILPALAIGVVGLPVGTTLVFLGLAATSGFLFIALPTTISMTFPWLLIAILHVLPFAPLYAPGFLAWALPCLACMTITAIIRWHQLEVWQQIPLVSPRQPMLITLCPDLAGTRSHNKKQIGLNIFANLDNVRRLRHIDQVGYTELAQVGPSATKTSLRVALGEGYLSKMWRNRPPPKNNNAFSRVVGLVIFAAVLTAWAFNSGPQAIEHFPTIGNYAIIKGYVALLGAALIASRQLTISKTWRQVNTELPTLALLPHLGHADDIKLALLRTIMEPVFRLTAGGFLVLLIITCITFQSLRETLCLLLIAPMWLTVMGATTLAILGGSTRRDTHLIEWAIYPAICILTSSSVFVTIAPSDTIADTWAQLAATWTLLGWAAFIIALALFAKRHWHRLQRRPHAFLVNDG